MAFSGRSNPFALDKLRISISAILTKANRDGVIPFDIFVAMKITFLSTMQALLFSMKMEHREEAREIMIKQMEEMIEEIKTFKDIPETIDELKEHLGVSDEVFDEATRDNEKAITELDKEDNPWGNSGG